MFLLQVLVAPSITGMHNHVFVNDCTIGEHNRLLLLFLGPNTISLLLED